ncbi:MAG: threonine synthase [bacterium]|nr:threonine synthase [bacterium]
MNQWPGVVEYYKQYLPVTEHTPIISLNEGATPLIQLKHLPKKIGVHADWYVKFEGLNPTGSFKDRGMCMAISKAAEAQAKIVMCASTGNTSAAAAAYAVRAGMRCVVVIPEGKIALGKLSQAMIKDALVLQIRGNFDDALRIVRDVCDSHPIALVNSVNPYRIEGQKTGAFEIVDQLGGRAPDYHFIPVGNAGNISAYWKGYTEYYEHKKITQLPKMMGYQAEGAAPLVLGHVVDKPETVATAIRIGNPASWHLAEAARDESGGVIESVSDDQITQAQKLLASEEGVFCEPASAASVAGVIKSVQQLGHSFEAGQVLVSVLTGHGLKDPNRAIDIVQQEPVVVDNDHAAVVAALKPLGL